jgi:hypothetical protein
VRLWTSLHTEDKERERENRQYFLHNSVIVPQKQLTYSYYWGTVIA